MVYSRDAPESIDSLLFTILKKNKIRAEALPRALRQKYI